MAEFNKKATIGVVANPILAQKSDPLHMLQMVKNLKCHPVTGVTDDEILLRARNLAHLELFCGFLPIWKGKKSPMLKYGGEPNLSLQEALGFKPASLAVRSPNLLTLDNDKESSFDFVAQRGIDFTFPTWHIRRTDKEFRFKQVFYVPDELLAELPNGSIKRTINYCDSGLDVFLSNSCYILCDGEHEKGQGRYYSPNGLDFPNLATPPKEVWDLALEIAKGEPKSKTRKRYYNTKSRKMNPCIICGRDERLWCSESDNGLIFCMNGSTFSSEREHGSLNIGDVVNGYALVKQSPTCNTFKFHEPQKRHTPIRPIRRRKALARR